MFRALIVACATALLFSVPAVAAEPPAVSVGKTHIFLSESSDSIHIGDGQGKIADIPYKYRKLVPPSSQSWEFQISNAVTSADINVLMYSLSGKNEYGCPTVLSVNGEDIYNLALSDNAKSGEDTRAKVAVRGDAFRLGVNTISITEKVCPGGGGLNDSLIKEVTIEVR